MLFESCKHSKKNTCSTLPLQTLFVYPPVTPDLRLTTARRISHYTAYLVASRPTNQHMQLYSCILVVVYGHLCSEIVEFAEIVIKLVWR
jgi:hypothetical protein